MIRFNDPGITYRLLAQELDAAVSEFFASGQYIMGPGLLRFEEQFAEYIGTRYCIGVGSGLDALRLTLEAAGVGPGDEVIVPSNTYIATWLAVTHVGATLVPVEPNDRSFNLDSEAVLSALTKRTRAIIPVHLYGQTSDLRGVLPAAREHGILVLEDAAQAHGARLGSEHVGNLATAGAFSFYPTKNLGAFGDGGAVTTSDQALAKRIRLLRNYGSSKRYVNDVVGINSRLDELQARLLSVRLRYLDDWNARRVTQANRYLAELQGVENLVLPSAVPGAHVWHQFVVRTEHRSELAAHLAADLIETLVHYPVPPHLQPAYAALGWGRGSFPVSETLHETVLSLPIGLHLSDNDQERVIESIQRFFSAT